MIRVELTKEQRRILEPLFKEVRHANLCGGNCGIVAQVWPDGFVAKALHNKQHDFLQKILGGEPIKFGSSKERISKHIKRKTLREKKTVVMPKELTAENGAKGLLSGEFKQSTTIDCAACSLLGNDKDCSLCGGTGKYELLITVNWTTIKEIYAMAVKKLAE